MPEEERVTRRLNVIHRAEVMQEIIKKHIGCIKAVGETNTDIRHFENLNALEIVAYYVIETIGRETLNAKRFEYSMKKSGEHAASVLKEIKSMINYILEESEEE